MGVSKYAVLALVVILAVPILMGYGMNLTETTISGYKISEDDNPVNVTPLLKSGTAYTVARGTTYQLNTNFRGTGVGYSIFPQYEAVNTSYSTTFPFQGGYETGWSGEVQQLAHVQEYYLEVDYPYSATEYVTVNIYHDSTLLRTYDHLKSIYYDAAADGINVHFSNSGVPLQGGEYTKLEFTVTGMASCNVFWGLTYSNNSGNHFTDLSAGYHFEKSADINEAWRAIMPQNTTSILYTVNLDSITDTDYKLTMNDNFYLEKSTTGGVSKWTAYRSWGGVVQEEYDLYYNPNFSDNTYQIYIQNSDESVPTQYPGINTYHRIVEYRYVGHWPDVFGEANYYNKYTFDYEWDSNSNSLDYLVFNVSVADQRTPTIRVDDATFRAFTYAVIENNTYDPSEFKDNPATTITDIQRYGKSLEFGGNTYTVSDGKITINSQKVPIDKIVFESVPNGSGGYDNMMGNTLISTTADPSTITFNGKWLASVATSSMESMSYTKTEWTPGQFAWDGLDQNFLMVGLLTSIGVFIALGIFIRRTKAALWPLLIACGGAAVLFFIML